MAGLSRTKGKCGERELARLLSELTGYQVARRVRNLAGEDDLQGLPGWSIEAKRYKAITPALIAGWWEQATRQAEAIGQEPVLFYRADRGQWRAVFSAELCNVNPEPLPTTATLEADPATWWALVGLC